MIDSLQTDGGWFSRILWFRISPWFLNRFWWFLDWNNEKNTFFQMMYFLWSFPRQINIMGLNLSRQNTKDCHFALMGFWPKPHKGEMKLYFDLEKQLLDSKTRIRHCKLLESSPNSCQKVANTSPTDRYGFWSSQESKDTNHRIRANQPPRNLQFRSKTVFIVFKKLYLGSPW